MLEGKESRDEDHDYPVYMAVVVVGHMARLGGCVAQQESCCWCWRGEERPLPAHWVLVLEQRRNFLLCYFYIHSVTQPATSTSTGPARECHSGRCVLVYICCGYVDHIK